MAGEVDSSGSATGERIGGDQFIANLAQFIRANSHRLASTLSSSGNNNNSSGWMFSTGSSSQVKPLTLTLSLYHVYFLLLKIQEAGFADVGDLDAAFDVAEIRRSAGTATVDTSDATSVRSAWTLASNFSLGSAASSLWWGGSSSSTGRGSSIERDLRYIYTAFTVLPALKIVLREGRDTAYYFKGKSREIEGFPFAEYPGDRRVPMKAFKGLRQIETQGIDARILLWTEEWDFLQSIRVRDAGLEHPAELLGSSNVDRLQTRAWPTTLVSLDLEHNDITVVDEEEITGLERLRSLSLKHNLLIAVPPALAYLSSLRSLDLSENMIESVLAIYKSLGALTILVLRGNRISSLCGLERLLSLEVLDIRDNDVYDVSELHRLVVLPHLQELYVSSGNPFLQDPAASAGNGWRIDLFNAFLQEASHDNGWNKHRLPRVDGLAPTWNESRYLVEPAHSAFVGHRTPREMNSNQQASHLAKARSIPNFRDRNPGGRDTEASVIRVAASPRRARQVSEGQARNSPGLRQRPGMPESTDATPPVPQLTVSRARDSADDHTKPKMVKKKHKRVVNLGGDTGERSASASPSLLKGSSAHTVHERSVSSPDSTTATMPSGNDVDPEGVHTRGTSAGGSTLGPDRQTISRQPSRQNQPPDTDSGSEVEDFRRKMEKLRTEVGVENWLSVYASTGSGSGSSRATSPAPQFTRAFTATQGPPKTGASTRIPKSSSGDDRAP